MSFLFLAAVVGGALNAVAGGGSFIALPALLYAGIPPVTANATTTMALWPGSVSSAIAYREHITTPGHRLLVLGAASLAGGLLGAMLLVRTSDSSFMRLLPWLMLAAALTFTLGGLRKPFAVAPGASARDDDVRRPNLALVAALQLTIAIYGGYFGGGMGIMMLAALALGGMSDIHEMNGLKSILAAAINGIALAAFVIAGSVAWTPGLVMVGGGIVGGYAGASLARRVHRDRVRLFVTIVSWTMTIYFFVR
jgi:uncharacterized protein